MRKVFLVGSAAIAIGLALFLATNVGADTTASDRDVPTECSLGDVETDSATVYSDGASLVPTPVPVPFPSPGSCGGNTCGPGQFCCNPSCGVCANRGDSCTQQVCPPTS